MKRLTAFMLLALLAARIGSAQNLKPVPAADERYKADILVVVAHPDDEGAVTPYLARAIYDEHKRVAVVFATRGGSGGNDYSREHGSALADIREQEARQACAALSITNVWFLDGKDTASQNVLNSLANWGHGANLEALVRIVRLTRPDVILSWLPGVFIGENHGDHQASGVLATEAFDLAGDPAAFPAQVAGASKRLEPYLENLAIWQPKKIYYFADASDDKQFVGQGPAYSVREISPSQKKPYWRLAIDAAKPHLTQFPEAIRKFSSMSDAELEKAMNDPDNSWWTEPMTLIFGKAKVAIQPWDAIFPEAEPKQSQPGSSLALKPVQPAARDDIEAAKLELGDPWHFYDAFRQAHKLTNLPVAAIPQIGVKDGTIVSVPLIITRKSGAARELELRVNAPNGWTVTNGASRLGLPDEEISYVRVDLQSPQVPAEHLKGRQPDAIAITGFADGKNIGAVTLRVQLQGSALPQ